MIHLIVWKMVNKKGQTPLQNFAAVYGLLYSDWDEKTSDEVIHSIMAQNPHS